jgi:hypothetical protein
MFHVSAIPDPSHCEVITCYAKGVAVFEPCVVQFVNRTRDQSAHELSALDRYVEGWAKADVDKICDASAPGYRFTDPLVGTYGRSSLHKYFDELRCRFSRIGTIGKDEFFFFLRGPMERTHVRRFQFWREAPLIGLTGVAEVQIGERGIVAEHVSYDGNLASDMLREIRLLPSTPSESRPTDRREATQDRHFAKNRAISSLSS